MTAKIKATILFKGIMGEIVAKHVWLVDHGRGKYAQYPSAVFIKYIAKGAHRVQGYWYGYNPYLVILDGWQDIKSQDIYGTPVQSGNVSIAHGKYQSFDPRWVQDFETSNPLKNIIADYRNVNIHEVLAA